MNKTHVFILAALAILAPLQAGAHKASVFAYADNGQVYGEGYYFDGRPCRGCAIRVLASPPGDEDEGGEKILFQGKTDEQGVFTFKDPIDTRPLIIKMDAGEGHLAVFTLEIKPERGPEGEQEGEILPIKRAALLPETIPECTPECTMKLEAIIEAHIDTEVDAQVEKRLASLRAEISRLRRESERPGLTEIFGGIGYIAGLAGIWLYAQSRKRDKK